MTDAEREVRQLRVELRKLANATTIALDAMDAEMKTPSDVNRGKRIAAILNELNLAHDGARHFGLHESFKRIAGWFRSAAAARAQRTTPAPRLPSAGGQG